MTNYFMNLFAFEMKNKFKHCTFLVLVFSVVSTVFSQNIESETGRSWWKNTAIYQIYPRSYKDSDGDGIGDLRGIISKLDYIKNLGFETIWISPFYRSPQMDFGYDISNYYDAAPEYGTRQTIDSLIQEVHKREMKIVFDMVLNHTSVEHPWFKESMSNKTNPKSDWYIWRDGKGKNPPNNWNDALSQRAWHYVKERDQWYYAAFLSFQPDLNYRNPEVKKAMFNVVKYWLDKGVDGFRLDIFNCIMEDKDFQDNPFVFRYFPSRDGLQAKFQSKTQNINHSDNFLLAQDLRKLIDEYENPKRFVIGEAIGPLQSIKPLVAENKGLNLIFLFDMIFYDFKASFFKEMIEEFESEFSDPLMPTIVFGNHDNLRSIGRVKNSLEKARLLALFQLTARGTPVVYYGEEIGMRNLKINKKVALDPISHEFNYIPQFVRNMLPLAVNRDVCRTPMQWNSEKHAGFSDSENKTWLPVDEDLEKRNVEDQSKDIHSLYNTYKSLLDLRNGNEAMNSGSMYLLSDKEIPKSVLAYEREKNGKKCIVFINFSSKSVKLRLPYEKLEKIYALNPTDKLQSESIELSGFGGIVLEKE